ncbi:MAG: lysophospholipid acyltransferase family protein [Geminicoccaceae bacterium]
MTFLRSGLFNLFFFVSTFVLLWPGTLVRLLAPDRVHGYAALWASLQLEALRLICGIRFEVIGREYLTQQGPALIASLHQSAFDTLVWMTLVPRCCYVVKRELMSIPLFGPMVRASGMIAVDREARAFALRSLLEHGERAAREGRQIVIFPEGTRAEPGARLPLQPGVAGLAARLGLPVIPVTTDSGAYWGRRAFRKRPGTIHVIIRPPLPANLPRRELMRRLDSALHDDGTPGPVDNPVELPSSGFSRHQSRNQYIIENS